MPPVVDDAEAVAAGRAIGDDLIGDDAVVQSPDADIAHHLRLAGRADTLFTDDAVARIHKAARAAVTEVTAE